MDLSLLPVAARLAGAGRRVWPALVALGLTLSAAGCGSLGSSSGTASDPLHPPAVGLSALRTNAEQKAIRKTVEADSFPTAAQAGL
jgi:hypothetical protein